MKIYSALLVLALFAVVAPAQGKKCSYDKCLKKCPKQKAKEDGVKAACKAECTTDQDKKKCMKECFKEKLKEYIGVCKDTDCARPECPNVFDCTDVCTKCDPPDTEEECKEACMTCKKGNNIAYGTCFTDCVNSPDKCNCDCTDVCSGLSECEGSCSEECEGDGATKKGCMGCLKKCKEPCFSCIKTCSKGEKECVGQCACDYPFNPGKRGRGKKGDKGTTERK